jgi:hypothetical protein
MTSAEQFVSCEENIGKRRQRNGFGPDRHHRQHDICAIVAVVGYLLVPNEPETRVATANN